MPSKKEVTKVKKAQTPAAKPASKKAIAAKKPATPKKAAVAPKKPAALPKETVTVSKAPQSKIESSLMIQGAKFIKSAFFFDAEKDNAGKRKGILPKQTEKPTAWSRPKVSNSMDSKNLVELLSQQLEYENRTYFEGCEGQICVKCNVNNVDQKFYVNKTLGYCTECAMLLDLGQSKEGVFSDAQMELMRRSMEKSMQKAKDIDENDIESALIDDMDTLELEEALLAAEEAIFND